MAELIALIILICSLFGILVILFRKIPVLVALPILQKAASQESVSLGIDEKIKNVLSKSSTIEIFLQKFLSKVRVITLKTDNQTTNWLQKLRARSQKKQEFQNDNYWEKINKKIKDENKE